MVAAQDQESVSPTPLKSAAAGSTEPLPEAPKDGILDAAEVFQPEKRQALATKLGAFRESHRFHVYISTYTFVYGEDANQRAERLGGKWLKGKQGAVIVLDRGGAENSPVVGMNWVCHDENHKLPYQTIINLMLHAKRQAEAQPANQPEERLRVAAEEIMSSYTRLHAEQQEALNASGVGQLKILGGVVALMFLCLGILMLAQRFQRKAAIAEEECYLFPQVEVGTRYGAPFGGGLVVQMHHGGKTPNAGDKL